MCKRRLKAPAGSRPLRGQSRCLERASSRLSVLVDLSRPDSRDEAPPSWPPSRATRRAEPCWGAKPCDRTVGRTDPNACDFSPAGPTAWSSACATSVRVIGRCPRPSPSSRRCARQARCQRPILWLSFRTTTVNACCNPPSHQHSFSHRGDQCCRRCRCRRQRQTQHATERSDRLLRVPPW